MLDPYTARLFQIESGGDPNAASPGGTNKGLAQFSPDLERRYGITDQNRADPAVQASAVSRERAEHAPRLTAALGRDPTDADFYLAHQQGLAGASALLSNPDQPAWKVLRPYYSSDAMAQKAVTGNIPHDHALSGSPVGMITAGDFANMWRNRFNAGHGPVDRAFTADPSRGPAMPEPTPMDEAQYPGIMGKIVNGFDPGTTLQKMGAWLMAAHNPGGSAALINAADEDNRLKMQRFTLSKDAFGRPIIFDARRGRVQYPQGSGTPEGDAMMQTPEAVKRRADLQIKKDQDLLADLRTGATAAEEGKARAQKLVELLKTPDVYTGPGGETAMTLKNIPLINMLYGSGGSNTAEAQKLMAGLQNDLLAGLKGVRFAGPEIAQAKSAGAAMDKPNQANIDIANDAIARHEYAIQANKLAMDYYEKHGQLGPGFQAELAKLRERMPGVSPLRPDQAAAATPAGALPAGVKSIQIVQ